MIRIDKLIEELNKFPLDSLAYAYEGEICGIVIVEPDQPERELGYILASERDIDFEGPANIKKVD